MTSTQSPLGSVVFALAVALAGSILSAASGPVSILVRDARTHYAVRATVKLKGPHPASLQTDAAGRLNHMVPAGKYGVWYGVEVSAPGYRVATNRLLPGLSFPLTIMLVPEEPPEEERPEAVARHLRPGYTLLRGYTVDVNTGQPVSGVRVRAAKAKAETLTDARGHYWLSVPAAAFSQAEVPPTGTVIAEKNGYEGIIVDKVSIATEDMQGPMFDMKKGRPWDDLGHTLESARSSLRAGADPNLKDAQGWTALTLACNSGNTALVQTLVEAGADVNLEGAGGWTPLMEASYFNRAAIVDLLIQAGGIVNKKGKDGITALMLARWMCHSDVAEALTRAGAVTSPGEWLRPPQFEDFPITSVHKGVPAPVDLRSNAEAPSYRTRLKEGARKGPNFAGHYTVVSWGCGSNCESAMIVDASTGRVYDGFGDERGAELRINSNLVIADAGDRGATGYSDNPTDSLPVRYYVWTDHKFKLIYEEACSVRNKLQSEWSDQSPNRSRRGLRCEEVNPAAQSRLRKELVACLRYVLLVWMSTRIPSRWE